MWANYEVGFGLSINFFCKVRSPLFSFFGRVVEGGGVWADPVLFEQVGMWAISRAYIYAVKLKSGPRFGGFKVKKWSKFKVKKWSKFFSHCLPHFYSVLGHF